MAKFFVNARFFIYLFIYFFADSFPIFSRFFSFPFSLPFFSLSSTPYPLSIHWKGFGLSPSKNLEMGH